MLETQWPIELVLNVEYRRWVQFDKQDVVTDNIQQNRVLAREFRVFSLVDQS